MEVLWQAREQGWLVDLQLNVGPFIHIESNTISREFLFLISYHYDYQGSHHACIQLLFTPFQIVSHFGFSKRHIIYYIIRHNVHLDAQQKLCTTKTETTYHFKRSEQNFQYSFGHCVNMASKQKGKNAQLWYPMHGMNRQSNYLLHVDGYIMLKLCFELDSFCIGLSYCNKWRTDPLGYKE